MTLAKSQVLDALDHFPTGHWATDYYSLNQKYCALGWIAQYWGHLFANTVIGGSTFPPSTFLSFEMQKEITYLNDQSRSESEALNAVRTYVEGVEEWN